MSNEPIELAYENEDIHFKSLFLDRFQVKSGPQNADSGFALINNYIKAVYFPLQISFEKNPFTNENIKSLERLVTDMQSMNDIVSLGKFKMFDHESLQKYKSKLNEIKPKESNITRVDYRLYNRIVYIRDRTYKPLIRKLLSMISNQNKIDTTNEEENIKKYMEEKIVPKLNLFL